MKGLLTVAIPLRLRGAGLRLISRLAPWAERGVLPARPRLEAPSFATDTRPRQASWRLASLGVRLVRSKWERTQLTPHRRLASRKASSSRSSCKMAMVSTCLCCAAFELARSRSSASARHSSLSNSSCSEVIGSSGVLPSGVKAGAVDKRALGSVVLAYRGESVRLDRCDGWLALA